MSCYITDSQAGEVRDRLEARFREAEYAQIDWKRDKEAKKKRAKTERRAPQPQQESP